MKQKAMDMKLVVKPLVGCLTHTHFWETGEIWKAGDHLAEWKRRN